MRRLFRFSATAAVMITALLVAVYLIRQSKRVLLREVDFDPDACVRLFDITRVYRIRAADDDPEVLWFATAEGVRVLDTRSLEWRRYGMDHGLTSETIVDVCFDDGVVWAATWNGLSRLRPGGERFETLPFSVGLGGTRILAVESVPDEGIFFSVDLRGLYHLGPGDSVPVRVEIPEVAASSRITCLKLLPNGRLLVGVEGRRLLEYAVSEGRFKSFAFERPGSDKTYIWDVMVRNEAMWVATSDDGLWLADRGEDTLRSVKGFPAKGAYVFAAEEDGFFCGTPFGLWRYHELGDRGAWVQLVHPEEKNATDFQVFTLANTPEVLWYGSMELGAGYLRKKQVQWMPLRAGLSSPNVIALAADDSLVWTAYGFAGDHIDRFYVEDVQYDRNYNQLDGILDPQIQCLVSTADRIYYGGFGSFGWLGRSGVSGRYFGPQSGLPYGDIAAIHVRDDGTLYLGSRFGLIRYDTAADSFALETATEGIRITEIVPHDGRLWLGTLARGLRLFDPQTGREEGRWLEGTMRIVAVGISGDGEVMAATTHSGLYRIGAEPGDAQRIAVPRGLIAESSGERDAHVTAARMIDGRMWLGTRAAGCAIYDPLHERWSTFTYYDGLVSDEVRSFTDTQDYIWIGCQGGVNRLDKTYIARTLFVDGTQGREAG